MIGKLINKDAKILMLGCGNSGINFTVFVLHYSGLLELSEDMYKCGYENIYNIDISPVVIEKMKERTRDMINMKCNFHIKSKLIKLLRGSYGCLKTRIYWWLLWYCYW